MKPTLLLLLLSRHSAKSSIAQAERLSGDKAPRTARNNYEGALTLLSALLSSHRKRRTQLVFQQKSILVSTFGYEQP